MKKLKRVTALGAVIVLAGMYGISLVAAIMARPDAMEFFKVSVILTLFLPILIYCFWFICRMVTGKGETAEEKGKENAVGFEEAKGNQKQK